MPTRRSRLARSAAQSALAASLSRFRAGLDLPEAFAPDALAEAEAAARGVPIEAAADLDDLRGIDFCTIDPEGSLDLDQALHLERTPDGGVLHYAIADVPAFVAPGGAVDAAARVRGQTIYAADGRIPLHPPTLSEGAASLLPGVDRRAFVWRFVLDEGARPVETSLRRGLIRSRTQWSYEGAQTAIDEHSAPGSLAALRWFGAARTARERERGGASLNLPDTQVERGERGYRLVQRRLLPVEEWNAQASLLTGMTAAAIMLAGRVGVLRTLRAADEEDVEAFRCRTRTLGVPWPVGVPYGEYLRTVDRSDPAGLAVLDAAASLFRGAAYEAFDGTVPTHPVQAAVAAPYAHVTAPLRRLVDRWGLVVCEALANGREVPAWARSSLGELPRIMARTGQRASQLERGTVDRVEAALMAGREGGHFDAVVLARRTDKVRVQIARPPVTSDVPGLAAEPGTTVLLRLDAADVEAGTITLSPAP